MQTSADGKPRPPETKSDDGEARWKITETWSYPLLQDTMEAVEHVERLISQLAMLYVALYTITLCGGDMKSNISGFGSDKFDTSDPRRKQESHPANPEQLNGYGNSTVPHSTQFRDVKSNSTSSDQAMKILLLLRVDYFPTTISWWIMMGESNLHLGVAAPPALDELISNLKVHEVVMEKDSKIYRGKNERVKSIALKANKESSDDETSTSRSDDEEYAMTVRNFKKFFRRKGKFVRQPREEKKSFRHRDEKKGKSDWKCF
ncbi:zf-CCHC domain-containing protein [Tanacetum coccineum]